MLRTTFLSTITFCLTFLLMKTQFQGIYGDSTSSENGTLERITSGIVHLHEGKFAEAAENFQLIYVSSQNLSYDKVTRSSKVASSAFRHLKTGQFAVAAAIFQEASDENYVEGEFLTSSTALAVAVFDCCRDASLLAVRGHLQLKQGKFNDSVDTFQQARTKSNISEVASTFDNCVEAITVASSGKSLLLGGYFKEAVTIFQRAYEKSNIDAVSFTLFSFKTQSDLAKKGVDFIQNGLFDNSSANFQKAYEISSVPSFYDTFTQYRDAANEAKLGKELFMQGMFSNALIRFQNAFNKTQINILDSYISATMIATQAFKLLADNKTSEAASHFEQALVMSRNNLLPDSVEVLVNCRDTLKVAAEGVALMNNMRLDEALHKFREAFSKSTVREVKYLLSAYKKLPYADESCYCSHDDFVTTE